MLYDPKWEVPVTTSPRKEVLIAARKLIENPASWCGYDPNCTPDESRNCSATAIWSVTGGRENEVSRQAYEHLAAVMGVEHVGTFNDRHTHAEVLAKFDEAIATA